MIEEVEIGVEESVAEGIEEEVEVQARLVKAKEVAEELHQNAGFLSQISHSKWNGRKLKTCLGRQSNEKFCVQPAGGGAFQNIASILCQT